MTTESRTLAPRLSPAQTDALAAVDARAAELSDWCASIFDFAETAWREYRSAAWYVVATVDTTLSQSVGPVRLPGLDPAATYDVVDRTPAGPGHRGGLGTTWLDGEGVVATGATLGQAGVRFPPLAPEAAHVLHVTLR